jgi:hypothetical protein
MTGDINCSETAQFYLKHYEFLYAAVLKQCYYDFIECFTGKGTAKIFTQTEGYQPQEGYDGDKKFNPELNEEILVAVRSCLAHSLQVKVLDPELHNVSTFLSNMIFVF